MHARKLVLTSVCSLLPLALAGCILVVDADGVEGWNGHRSNRSDSIRGSGVSASETRTVANFERVEINCSADLSLAVGSEATLSVSGDDNLLKYLKTDVRDGALVIEMDSGSYSPRSGMKVRATVPALRALSIRGSSDADLSGLEGGKFSIDIAGSGDARASGRVDRLEVGIAGSGDVKFGEVEAREASVQISGSGDVDVWATESLSVSIAGSGDVRYKGEPKVTKSIAGSGGLMRR